MSIQAIPLEIQEEILSYLDIADLVVAAKSWVVWRHVGNCRLFKRWCLKNISPDVLNEISENQFSGIIGSPLSAKVRDEFDWLDLVTKWAKTARTSQMEPDSEGKVAEQFQTPTVVTKYCNCMAVSGDVVVIGDHSNNLVWYDCNGVKIAKKGNLGEPVSAIGLLNICRKEPYDVPPGKYSAQHDAVIVLSDNFITIYSMPMWNCQELYFVNIRHGKKHISALGNQFAYFNSHQNRMTVCVVQKSPCSQWNSVENPQRYPWKLEVKSRGTFDTRYNVHNWKLWKNSVICLLQNGTIMTWNIDEATSSRSIFVSDFMYPYESFLYRGLIFCNISTARDLLHYWHVNMGAPHWLVSSDGLTFKRVNTSISCNDEITTLHVKRTVIVAGTAHGKICIYRHIGSDHGLPDVILEKPSLIYKIADTPIFKCDFSMDGDEMIILAKTTSLVLLVKVPVTEKYY